MEKVYREKATQLAIKFCDSTDVIRPNKASVARAIVCVDEFLESKALFSDATLLLLNKHKPGVTSKLSNTSKKSYWVNIKRHLIDLKL